MTTAFLAGLEPLAPTHPAARAALDYLAKRKRIRQPERFALGWEADEQNPNARCYFFFLATERDRGILEMLASPMGGDWSVRVADFIGDRAIIADMLGDFQLPGAPEPGHIDPGDGTRVVFSGL